MALRPTPSSIALCVLVYLHESNENSNEELPDYLRDPKSFETLDESIQQEALRWLDGISLDGLVDLMHTLQTSNHRYVKSVCLGFEQLSFHQVGQLWEDIVQAGTDRVVATPTNDEDDERVLEAVWAHERYHKDTVVQDAAALESTSAAAFLRYLHCLDAGEQAGASHALHFYLDGHLEALPFATLLQQGGTPAQALHVAQQSRNPDSVRLAKQQWKHDPTVGKETTTLATAAGVEDPHISVRDARTARQNRARAHLYGQPGAESRTGVVYADAIAVLLEDGDDSALQRDKALYEMEWAIRREHFELAEALCLRLQGELHPRIPNYEQVRLDIYSLKCLLLARRGWYDESEELTLELIQECGSFWSIQARLRLQLAQSLLDATTTREFAGAMPHILQCLYLCDKHELKDVHSAAMVVLAHIHLRMENTETAIQFLLAAMPTLLDHEHVFWQAEAHLTLARCHLKLAEKRPKRLRKALDALVQSEGLFRRVQDCTRLREVYFLQAGIQDKLQNTEARNQASESFVKLSKWRMQRRVRGVFADAAVAVAEFESCLGGASVTV